MYLFVSAKDEDLQCDFVVFRSQKLCEVILLFNNLSKDASEIVLFELSKISQFGKFIMIGTSPRPKTDAKTHRPMCYVLHMVHVASFI